MVQPLDLGEKLVKASQSKTLFKKLVKDSIFCNRCCTLQANDLSNPSISEWQKQLRMVDKQTLVRRVFKKIGRQSIIVLVLDVNDINGSYPEKEVIELINQKEVQTR